jgi:hypothetical protein
MKRQTEKPSEHVMRFFTPELYLQFNSSDDEVADSADQAWEQALQAYQRHLETLRDRMPTSVSNVAELKLAFERELPSPFPVPESVWPFPVWSTAAIMSLKQGDVIRNLIYMLWDRVRDFPARENWPFSKSRKHWLYDELDVAGDHQGMFLQRILFSDGNVVEIPFVSAITSSLTLPASQEGSTTRRIA